MPDSPMGWVGLSMALAIVIAILLISVGCILYYVPAKTGQAQRLLRSGATLALGVIFVAGLLGALMGRSDGKDWGRAALVLLIGGVTFGGPSLWRRLTHRG